MKFSKTIKRLGEIDTVFGPHYIQFKLLKKFLKEIQGKDSNESQATFVQLVENEHQRVKKLIEYKVAELQLQCSSIVTNIRILDANIDRKPEEIKAQLLQLTSHADQMGETLAATERFVFYNKEGFRKIVKKHDKLTRVSLSWLEAQKLRTFFVHTESDLERLLVELSDIYKFIHEHTNQAGPGEHKVSDDTFERKSYKYWVAIEDVFRFKTKMIKHLPLHIFARKTDDKFQRRKTVVDLLMHETEEDDKTEYGKIGWISSVYFDNDKMECYKTRVNFEEGATLFRVRWYGDPKDVQRTDVMNLPRAPVKGCYYERKTHHESWVQATSVKERFPIPESKILDFMKGEVTPEEVLKDEKLLPLAHEMQGEIISRQLHPIIRTVYKRAAFQQDNTNDVRITLDTNLTFVNERWADVEEGAWKRDEEEVEAEGDWRVFPYAVLEVKLKAGEPQWLQEILDEPYIRKVHKFSKFQQASATFFPSTIHMFPYWFTEDDVADVKSRLAHEDEKWEKMKEDSQNDVISTTTSSNLTSGSALGVDNVAFDLAQEKGIKDDPPIPFVVNDEMKVFRSADFQVQSVVKDLETRSSLKGKGYSSNRWKKSKKGSKVNGKATSFGGIPGKEGKDKAKFASARVKIEPKTFFANERTFLQWLRSGLSLFSLGGILYGLSPDRPSQISGLVFSILAIVVCLYGMGFFYWRMNMIKNRRNQRYDDWFGPAFLAVLILGGLVTSIVLQQTANNTPDPGTDPGQPEASQTWNSFNHNTDGSSCRSVVSLSGLPAFTAPSSLAYTTSGAVYTCAGDKIAFIQRETGNVESYINLKGAAECKAVTSIAGGKVGAVVHDQLAGKQLLIILDEGGKVEHSVDLSKLSGLGDVTGVVHVTQLYRNYSSIELTLPGTFFLSTTTTTTSIVVTSSPTSLDSVPIVSFAIDEGATALGISQGHMLMTSSNDVIHIYSLTTGEKLSPFYPQSDVGTLAGLTEVEGKLLGITRQPPQLVTMETDVTAGTYACAAAWI